MTALNFPTWMRCVKGDDPTPEALHTLLGMCRSISLCADEEEGARAGA